MENNTYTRLTKQDLQAIENRIDVELGSPPSLDEIKQNTEQTQLNDVLKSIAGAGRVITLLVAEVIQSGAALIIAVVFGLLEYWRVLHGAEALGQNYEQSALIAFAVVTANVVHPIYRLRQLQGKQHITTQNTLRGYLSSVWRKIFNKPQTIEQDWQHNPVLDAAAITISLTTVFLAVFDLVSPLLTSIIDGTSTEPMLILVIKLIMGFGLSIAGVFFLQAAAHEIGVRTLTDKPIDANELYQQQLADYQSKKDEIRQRVTQEHIQAKIQDKARGEKVFPTIVHSNGNGHVKHLAER